MIALKMPPNPNQPRFAFAHIPYLDGLRGVAASWVYLSHVSILTGASIPLISDGHLAVDLFMILSGFLMTSNYHELANSQIWSSSKTWREFWIKRFFRIAPMFYMALLVSIFMSPIMAQSRDLIAQHYPDAATETSRYLDRSLSNIFFHVTFVFGLLPSYSFRTPLPDWSIGLEMQFYIAFPFIMLMWIRFGPFLTTAMLLLLCTFATHLFSEYINSFPMPSILVLKLYLFNVGILIAESIFCKKKANRILLSMFPLAMPVAARIANICDTNLMIMQIALILSFTLLALQKDLIEAPLIGAFVKKIISLMDNPILRWLGDISYSVYLVHILVVIPCSAGLFSISWYPDLNPFARFALCFSLSSVPVYLISTACYYFIERPGVRFGKNFLTRLNS